MTRIEESVDIGRPVEKVFAYTTDAKSWPEWQTIIPEAEQTSAGPVGVGTSFKGVSRMIGRSVPWTASATECEPPRKFGKNIAAGALFIEQHNTYVPVDGGTRFTLVYDLTVHGVLKLLSPMVVASMRRELRKSLGNLKRNLEARTEARPGSVAAGL
jgi:hypothetical protein